jgi:hypothetical protein
MVRMAPILARDAVRASRKSPPLVDKIDAAGTDENRRIGPLSSRFAVL